MNTIIRVNMFFLQRIRLIILNIISLLRRLCCFSKRRKVSLQYGASQEPEIVVVVERRSKNDAERDWNTWDDQPRTIEEHIEQYRERISAPPTQEEAVEPDFFKELTPVIKPQLKYYLPTEEKEKKENHTFSRLAAPSIPINAHGDLEDWEDEDNDQELTGWEQLDAAQAKQIIREKRMQSRNKRHETAAKPNAVALNAVRLSNEQKLNT